MSRFKVEADFRLGGNWPPGGSPMAGLEALAVIHGGQAYPRPGGWRLALFVNAPTTADAARDGGMMMRQLNLDAGMPQAVMTDLHVHRLMGEEVLKGARHELDSPMRL